MRTSLQTVAGFAFVAGIGAGLLGGRLFEPEPVAGHPHSASAPRRPAAERAGSHADDHLAAPRAKVELAAPLGPATPGTVGALAATHAHSCDDDHEDGPPPAMDEAAVARAIARFQDSRDPQEIEALAGTLGVAGGKTAAQAAARVLAAGGSSPDDLVRREAAFQILATQEDAAARGPALDVLARETDASLRQAAASALGSSRNASQEEAQVVGPRLAALVQSDPDPEVRRRAVRALARWRTSDADLAPILHALENDGDENVRGACAFAIEDERVRSPEAVATLARVVSDPRAPASVRELASEALARLGPLDPAARQALARSEAR